MKLNKLVLGALLTAGIVSAAYAYTSGCFDKDAPKKVVDETPVEIISVQKQKTLAGYTLGTDISEFKDIHKKFKAEIHKINDTKDIESSFKYLVESEASNKNVKLSFYAYVTPQNLISYKLNKIQLLPANKFESENIDSICKELTINKMECFKFGDYVPVRYRNLGRFGYGTRESKEEVYERTTNELKIAADNAIVLEGYYPIEAQNLVKETMFNIKKGSIPVLNTDADVLKSSDLPGMSLGI